MFSAALQGRAQSRAMHRMRSLKVDDSDPETLTYISFSESIGAKVTQ